MAVLKYMRLSFTKKLIIFYILLLIIATLIIGITGFSIARAALKTNGKIILKNAVILALDIVQSEYEKAEAGLIDHELAQEKVKEVLLGTRGSDGLRIPHNRIDLGEHGYFIIYDRLGNEILHPVLEGQNTWDSRDMKDGEMYITRNQIELGLSGGGFLNYSWVLPGTDTLAEKISYSAYDPHWEWIIVASSYMKDFDKETGTIFFINLIVVLAVVAVLSLITVAYVQSVTQPVINVAEGMDKVASGSYSTIEKHSSHDEVERLIDGYNNMINSLSKANNDIKKKSEYISYLAYNDELTSLPNRHGLKLFVEKRISSGCPLAFFVQADIIGLKVINSTLGFEHGDQILKLIGKYFMEIETSSFQVARSSSNEFTIWIEESTRERASIALYAMRDAVRGYVEQKGYSQLVDMHLVMVEYPSDGEVFETLYEKSTMAMKIAKDRNDRSIVGYEPLMKQSVENQVRMRQHLKNALDRGELFASYQKQVDCVTGKVVGVEALARWESQELGFVGPDVFIPAITALNLVDEFSEYMVSHVCSNHAKLLQKYGKDISISINISPSYMMNRSFYDTLKGTLERENISPASITLEITEDVFISDYSTVSGTIGKLQDLGIRIAIDDFGTGYSSLNYLTNISFDEMKIDRSFVDRILDEPKAFEMFKILCNIAQIYEYDIVAEGVETEEQLARIKQTPLRIIQGYFYSRPEPL